MSAVLSEVATTDLAPSFSFSEDNGFLTGDSRVKSFNPAASYNHSNGIQSMPDDDDDKTRTFLLGVAKLVTGERGTADIVAQKEAGECGGWLGWWWSETEKHGGASRCYITFRSMALFGQFNNANVIKRVDYESNTHADGT
jgi:hypothetical protein